MADTAIEWTGRPRTVDPRGYVLIRFPEHPRADVRGYVYEHLLAGEALLGRPLVKGERVRHIDNQPGNNVPSNLRIVAPLDRQSTVACACGCDTRMTLLDGAGRVRNYVSGHNPHLAPTTTAIMAKLAASPDACVSLADVAEATGGTVRSVAMALSKLARLGRVERPRSGYYRLPGSSATYPPRVPKQRSRPKCERTAGLRLATKEALTEDFGGLCAYGCARPAVTWDHLIPWADGGSFTWIGNAAPTCHPCNQSKNDRHPAPWVARGLAAAYSSEAMESLVILAVCHGMADPDDLFEPEADGNELGGRTWDEYPKDGAA